MKKILNIGCGRKIIDGAVNLDIVKLPGVNVVHDIERFPWPFKKNEFDEVHAYSILEHVTDFVKTMEEIHRILKPGGLLIGWGPYYMHKDTFTDPTHKRGFTTKTFQYFEDGNDLSFYTKSKFKIEEIKLVYNNKSLYKFVPLKKFLGYLLWNLVQGLHFKLRAVK